jgi:hypothetical protein
LIGTDQAPEGKIWSAASPSCWECSPRVKQIPQESNQMDNEVTRPQGGTKDDTTYPNGVGEVSPDQPVLPSRQPIPTLNLPYTVTS